MPVSITQMAANTASVTFTADSAGNTVTVVYFPALVTEKTFASLQSFDAMQQNSIVDSFAELNDVLIRLIKSWDVYDDEAQTVMFPLDAERLKELPIPFRMKVLGAVLGDLNPEAVAA
jgi:hypothetical protein